MSENRKPWRYKALEVLETDFDDIENLFFQNVFLVPYAINEGSNYPFLEFGLKKKPDVGKSIETSQLLTFPSSLGTNKEQIFEFGKKVMDFLLEGKITFENVRQSEILFSGSEEYEFKGYKKDGENLYVFVDVSEWKKNDILSMERNSVLWFVLVDEIKNAHHTSLFPWTKHVSDFFEANPIFLSLYDENGREYDNPHVVYIPNPVKKLKFKAIFGPQKGEEYFRDYKDALEKGRETCTTGDGWWGLVKYALIPSSSLEKQDFSNHVRLEGLSFHVIDKNKVNEEHENYIL